MPSIAPAQLRTFAQQLAADGVVTRADVDQLIDKALGDGALTPELSAELSGILETFGDKIESTATAARLKNFLAIEDPGLQALSFRLEQDDGTLTAADADKLIALAGQDGTVSDKEKFSLSAVLIGTRLDAAARQALSAAAGLTASSFSAAPKLAIPDNDAAGVDAPLTVDAQGQIADISLDIDLDHTWRGDLRVSLIAPDGTSVMLHDRAGRSDDNLKGTFGKDLVPTESLDKLIGKSAAGEWKLHVEDRAGQDLGVLNNFTLHVTTTSRPTEPTGNKAMDPSGQHRPVFLTADGFFVESEGAGKPDTNAALGTGLFRMADLIDDLKENPFVKQDLPLAQRQKILENLQGALQKVAPGATPPADMTDTQVLQMRASVATVLLGLIEATGTSGAERELLDEAFMAYRGALNAETHPVIKDSMTWNLVAVKDRLPGPLKSKVDDIHETIAPSSPPYDEWFKDGNKELNIAWSNGPDPEFFPGTLYMLDKKGFKKVDENDTTPPVVMTKTFNVNGQETVVNITVTVNHGHKIFDKMDDENVHIVGYDGHSDFGRNIPSSLARGSDEAGKKLIFYGLCAGKDNISRVRERYPDSQVLTSFNSSYFRTSTINGQKTMTDSENVETLNQLIEGVARRADWQTINDNIRDRGVWSSSHVMPGGTNYISPAHTMIRRKVLDTDHDGQADILDKLVHFDAQKVAEDTAREWTPIDPGRPADLLDGTRAHIAAMGINTATGYNTHTQKWKKQNVIGAGYFEPGPGEANKIIKFDKATIDGIESLEMRVNKNFAHMSVEALRAIGGYQLMMDAGQGSSWSPDLSVTDRKLMALTFAAALLEYDSNRWGRDPQVWQGLLTTLNFPPELELRSLSSLIGAEHHDYTGSMSIVRKYKEGLDPAVLAQLNDPAVGVPT